MFDDIAAWVFEIEDDTVNWLEDIILDIRTLEEKHPILAISLQQSPST